MFVIEAHRLTAVTAVLCVILLRNVDSDIHLQISLVSAKKAIDAVVNYNVCFVKLSTSYILQVCCPGCLITIA